MKPRFLPRILLVCLFLMFAFLAAAIPLPLMEAETKGGRLAILGSIHVLSPEDYPLDPEIERAFAEAELLLFETDVAALEGPEALNRLMLKAAYPPGKSLKSELSSDLYVELERVFTEFGLGIAPFNRFRPWFIQLFLTMSHLVELDFDPELGLDTYLYRKATEQGKAYAGLESVEEQLGLLQSLDGAHQEALLWSVIDELDAGEEAFSSLVEAWRRGDIEGLQREVDSLREYPELYNQLILDRNRRWAAQIPGYLEPGKDLLVVVGAGHLGGEEGLIALLENEGYRFRQVESAADD